VQGALDEISARRDARDLALHDIEVQALGMSGVVQLTVTDSDPNLAVALANEIGKAVIQKRLEVTAGQAATVVRDLDKQISEMQAQAGGLERTIDGLNPKNGATRAQLDELLVQRDASPSA